MATTWGTWMRFDFNRAIDDGRIATGTPIQCSMRPNWLPRWLARLFVDPDKEVIRATWPAPGERLNPRTQLVRFKAGSPEERQASVIARGF